MKSAPFFVLLLILAGCGSAPPPRTTSAEPAPVISDSRRQEIVLYSLGLLDVGYRFGGENPESGLDCSGMVAYIYQQAAGIELPHNAARIAERTTPVALGSAKPGDLVFFNTTGKPYSHMGIYLGGGRFIHAPSSNRKVRVEKLGNRYWAGRLTGARTVFR